MSLRNFNFNINEHRYDDNGRRRTQTELNQLQEEFNQQKQIKIEKMKKSIKIGSLILGVLLFLTLISERIDAGHVGVKVNLYGSQKGIDGITEVSGMVWYNPLASRIYEFPTYVQHKEYVEDESFVVNSQDGSEFKVSPIVNYEVIPEKVPYIFGKYRKSLEKIESGFLKTAVVDAFRIATNSYTADSLISNRQSFEIKVRSILESQLKKEGFRIQQFTSNLVYPKTFMEAIDAKNNSVQQALKAENDVKTAEARAKIKVAEADGDAQSMIARAKAEAESNRLRQETLTPSLLQLKWIERWDGKLSLYGQSPMLYKPVQ